MKRGFTLVELSIVLVIIGLLIGGILVAQSMISAAKINAQVKQIQEFDVAISNFKTKYGQLPGDSTAMGCTSNNCNNGLILDSAAYGSNLHSTWYWWNTETATFWVDLQASGLYSKESYTATIPAGGINTGSTKNVPTGILGQKSMFMVAASRSRWPDTKYYNHYFLADFTAVTDAVADILNEEASHSISPNDLMALDKKMDDGLYNSGMVRARGVGAVTGSYLGWGGPIAGCVTGGRYVSSDSLTCAGVIDILSVTGENN